MERKPIELEKPFPDMGKRLLDVENPAMYLNQDMRDLQQRVFCESCGKDYKLGERKVETNTATRCPTTKDEEQCDGSTEELIVVKDGRDLAKLRRKASPAAPF